MRYVLPMLIILGLLGLVVINAGGGREAMKVGWSILIVMGGILLMAVLFALFITKPSL
jgi:hypothetical protein